NLTAGTSDVEVLQNEVTDAAGYGILASAGARVHIASNKVSRSGDQGVEIWRSRHHPRARRELVHRRAQRVVLQCAARRARGERDLSRRSDREHLALEPVARQPGYG